MTRISATQPTFDEKRSAPKPCHRNRHRLTGDLDLHLFCPHCGAARPEGRWGAVWAQPEEAFSE